MEKLKAAIVIGAGNWGRPLAGLLARNVPVRLWTIDHAEADSIIARRDELLHKNSRAQKIVIEPKFTSNIAEQDTLIVMAVPSSQVSDVAAELASHTTAPTVLSLSKGFDIDRFCTPGGMIVRQIPKAKVVCLTGPTIANEINMGLPTTAVLSSDHLAELARVKEVLRNDVINFVIDRNPVHHEVCAALKGIVAIGVGMAEGLELGINFQSVVITQGIKEMTRIASFFDIPEEVVYGLSGIGDVMTTCMSPDSRNRKLGCLIGRGLSLKEALTQVQMTVEGVSMSKTIETLWSLDVSISLFHFIDNAIFNKNPDLRGDFIKLIRSFS
jgi:glycerol-3-phosphate dehydrogenase (NAD(P)+)